MTDVSNITVNLNPELVDAFLNRGTFDKSRSFNIPLQIEKTSDVPEREVAVEQSAEPIADEKDINRIVKYLLENERFRDAMLFVVGINTGLRYSDLVSLRFSDVIDENGYFVEDLKLIEIKTRNTKGKKQGSKNAKAHPVNRHLYLNEAVRRIICIYLEHNNVSRGDLMFRSTGNRAKSLEKGLSHTAVDNIFKPLIKELGIEGRYSTHFMRKTFSYHLLMRAGSNSGLNSRSVEWLQLTLGHSSTATTLKYAGYQSREIRGFYGSLNLGLDAIKQYTKEVKGIGQLDISRQNI